MQLFTPVISGGEVFLRDGHLNFIRLPTYFETFYFVKTSHQDLKVIRILRMIRTIDCGIDLVSIFDDNTSGMLGFAQLFEFT